LLPNPSRTRKKTQSLRVGSIHETPLHYSCKKEKRKTLTRREEIEIEIERGRDSDMDEWEMLGNGPTCIELRDLVLINSQKCFLCELGLRCGPTRSLASKRLLCFWLKNSEILWQAKQKLSRENEWERNWRLAAS